MYNFKRSRAFFFEDSRIVVVRARLRKVMREFSVWGLVKMTSGIGGINIAPRVEESIGKELPQ